MHVTPSQKFLKALRNEKIELRGHDLGASGSYAVAAALTVFAFSRFLFFSSLFKYLATLILKPIGKCIGLILISNQYKYK